MKIYRFNNYTKPNNPETGFTLLEVLISMVILAFISLAIYQLTTSSFSLRERLHTEGDFTAGIRVTLGIFERDVINCFSPQIRLAPPSTNGITFAQGQRPPLSILYMRDPNEFNQVNQALSGYADRSTRFWGPVLHPTGMRSGQFIGSENELGFVTQTNRRIYKDSPESRFVKVRYFLKDNPNPNNQNTKQFQFIKSISTKAFEFESEDIAQFRNIPLVSGLISWKFQYYHRLKKQWVSQWNTESQEQRDQFPAAVSIDYELIAQDQRKANGHFVVKLEVPYDGLDSTL